MFNIDIAKLKTAIDANKSLMEQLIAYKEISHDTVLNFSEEGFAGAAQVECLERFNTWINNLGAYIEKTAYIDATMNIALTEVLCLNQQSAELINPLGGMSSQCSQDTGIVHLSDTPTYITANSTYAQTDASDMLTNASSALSLINSVACSPTMSNYLYNSAENLKSELNDIDTKLENYKTQYNEYTQAIDNFETELSTKLEYAADSEFNVSDAMDKIGDYYNYVSGVVNLSKIGVLAKNGIKQTVNAVADGSYFRISKYGQWEMAPRYLISNLDKYPKLQAVIKSGKLAKAGKYMEYGGYVVDAITVGVVGYVEYNRNPYLPDDIKNTNTAVEVGIETVSVAAQIGAGIAIGAAVGSIIPGVGTAIGAVVAVAGVLATILVSVAIDAAVDKYARETEYGEEKETFTDKLKGWFGGY